MIEIEKQLKEYLDNSIYNYGFLIKGQWGSGKSYFVKKFIKKYENKKDNEKIFIYVSLNGLSRIEDIDIIIITEIIKHIKNKKYQVSLKKEFRKYINEKNILGLISKNYISLVSNILIDFITDEIKKENIIFIFDDIERCEIKIKKILAYINNYIEIKGLKVIIIANEEEIKEKDDYKKIKEKFIGTSLEFIQNIELIYKCFIDSIDNKSLKKILQVNEKNLLYEIKKQNHFNLRTVQFIIDKYIKLYNIVIKDSELYDDIEVNESVFKYLCFIAIKYKKGENLYDEWENNEQGYIILDKEKEYNNYIYGFKFVDEYIINGVLSVKLILDVLLQFRKKLLLKNGPYDILKNNYWEMEDNDIYKNIDDIKKNFENKTYNSSNILDCLILVLILIDYNYQINLDEFIKLFKETIEEDYGNNKLYFTSSLLDFSRTSKKVKEKYNEISDDLKYFVANLQFKKINEMVERAEFEEIFQMIRTDLTFCNFIMNNGFYCNINIDNLINIIKSGDLSSHRLMYFKYIFDELITNPQYIKIFSIEEKFIDRIIEELLNVEIKGSISRNNAIKNIVEDLEKNKNAIKKNNSIKKT